jgi:hypothetical protein
MEDWRTDLFWVWPDYVSAEFGGRYDCGAHPDWDPGYTVRHVDDLSFHVRIADAFGSTAEEQSEVAFNAAVRDREREASDGEKRCTEYARFDPRAWHIARHAGGWQAEGWSDTSRICGYGVDFPVTGDLERVTGRRGNDRQRLDSLKSSLPQVTDVHVGPDGVWMLATTGKELLLLDANLPGHVAARVPLGERESLVMVEWAVGDNVARWSAAVRHARDAGPVRPIIVR